MTQSSICWSTLNWYTFVRLDGKRYYVTLTFNGDVKHPSCWHYRIEAEDWSDARPMGTRLIYKLLDEGTFDGNNVGSRNVKPAAARKLRSLHKRLMETCTDCGGYAAPGAACVRCAKQFKEECAAALAAAETEGMVGSR